MRLAFVDESGSPRIPVKDTSNPFFALTAVVFDAEYYFYDAETVIDEFKRRWFGTADHVLHLENIRDHRDKTHAFLMDPNKRATFNQALNKLLNDLDFSCCSILVDMPKLETRYGKFAANPLILAHQFLGERLQKDSARLATRTKMGRVFYEECSYPATGLTQATFLTTIREDIVLKSPNIRGYHMSRKDENLAGIQIADLCAHPLRRHAAGMKPSVIHPDIVLGKLICNPDTGNPDGWGLKVFPK